MQFDNHPNIAKLYLSNFFTGFVFWYAIEKLFMQSINISPFGVGLNAVVFLAITVIFDVPSGVLADRWRRKYILISAIVSLGVGTTILGLSDSFVFYLIGTVFYGFYVVLTSGTFQAIMYDSLAEAGRQDQYDKHQGRSYGLFLGGIGLGSLAGGYIGASIGLREAYLYSMVSIVINILILCMMREPKFHKEIFDSAMVSHIKASIALIKSHSIVAHLAFFLIVAGILRSMQNEFGSLYYMALGLSTVTMGYVNAGKWLFGALGQLIAPYVGRVRSLAFVPWLFVIFLAFSILPGLFGLVFFFLAALLFSVISNQSEAVIQSYIPSGLRATSLSLISFASNIVLIPLSLLFGWMVEQQDVFKAYQVVGLLGILYTCIWLVKGRPHISKFIEQPPVLSKKIDIIK